MRDWDATAAWFNILGTMLFPDNQAKRLSWISRIFIRSRATSQEENDNDATFDSACRNIGKDFEELAKNFGGPKKIFEIFFGSQTNTLENEMSNRFGNGIIAGEVFLDALISTKSFTNVVEQYCYSRKHQTLKNKIVKNIWPLYLPMIHYWASLVTFIRHEGLLTTGNLTSADMIFDCPAFRSKGIPDGMKGFIRIAESYLFQGLTKTTIRTGPKTPLLHIKKMFFVFHPFMKFPSE